jgi:hypothetical protein
MALKELDGFAASFNPLMATLMIRLPVLRCREPLAVSP